jgi:hypothetical protein
MDNGSFFALNFGTGYRASNTRPAYDVSADMFGYSKDNQL